MKKLLLLFLLCGMMSTVGAETLVSGIISADQTFTIDQSPYNVTSSLTVNAGVTLTVDSGVVVKFNNGTKLSVKGTLDATNAIFTSANANAERGDWNGIHVGYYEDNAQMSLTDCSVLFATQIYLDRGTATIQNSTIQNSSAFGLLVNTDVTLNVTATTISDNAIPIQYAGWPAVATIDLATNLQDNDVDRLMVMPTTLNKDFTLNTINIPYCFDRYLTVSDNSTLSIEDDNVLTISNFTIDAGATLDIGSNSILKFKSGYYYGLDINGTLLAVAEADEHIFFTTEKDDNWGGDTNLDAGATDPSSEDWKGIVISGDAASGSVLTRCKVMFAGYNDRGGITITNSSPTIDYCNIASCYFGIYIAESSSPSISNTTIGASDMTPIAMSFESNPLFSSNVLSFMDNAYDAIGLIGGTMTRDGRIVKRDFTNIDNITYFMLDKIIVPDTVTLTIDPDIVIKASGSYDYYNRNIVVKGTLIANGTDTEPIVFTSAKDDNHGNPGDTNRDGTTETPVIGDFGAIVFGPGSSASSSLTYSYLKYARGHEREYQMNQYVNGAAVITVNSNPTISNNQIKDVMQGIRCYEASQPIISNNDVINVSSTPFAISPSASPVFSGNTFNNAGIMALGLLGGDMTQSGTVEKINLGGYDNISYSLLYDLSIKEGTYMTIDPGVVLKNNYSRITVEGGLRAMGSSTEKIIFTSIKDDNCGNPTDANGDGNATSPTMGDWTMIRFEESSDDDSCLIENAELRYAGADIYNSYIHNYVHASTIEISNANPTIRNSSIGQGHQYGVRIEGNSAPVLDGVTIQNMEFEPIGMSLTSNPTLTNLDFVANRAKGLAIIDAELSSDATLVSRDVAGIDNIAYVINGNLTIKPDAHLIINPGVNIKINRYNAAIYVEGAMSANGTEAQKIVFTSIKDDSSGGDTNNDGNIAPPTIGDWDGLHFKSSGLDSLNVLNYVSVRYGGSKYSNDVSVSFNACAGTVSNSSIELSQGYGLEIIGSANPSIQNTDFFNIEKAPVLMSMFAEPTFADNTMSNVGRQAIQLIAETYSKTGTFPIRDFAGVDSITYCLLGDYTINDGTVITIPAGMAFKSTEEVYWSGDYCSNGASFVVNGQLQVEGDVNNPAVFTSFYDDTQGRPMDTGSDGQVPNRYYNSPWFIFNDVSDDASAINNALLKYSICGVETKSASPSITNSTFEKCQRGILLTGVSEPSIVNNHFKDLEYSPMSVSLVAFPTAYNDNVISGSTYKVIEINEETLTRDVTLPKRDFGGITNVPYYFHGDYTVGTGAILSLDSGLVCKFNYGSKLLVEKGLMAQGGALKENNIVFTHISDDFYGGDSNSDSTTTSYSSSYYQGWEGIEFASTSINASCVLDRCVFRNIYNSSSYSAITAVSASPSITNSSFSNMPNGLTVKGSGNPVINYCDFYSISNNAVNNVDLSFDIDATNNWWSSNSGPTHTSNPLGEGMAITDGVNYTPWKTQGANNPMLGDVSLNGEVQAYDAALILKYTVGTYVFSQEQMDVADVTGNQGGNAISALDASMILRYSVGLINHFTATTLRSSSVINTSLRIDDMETMPQQQVELPIILANASGAYAFQVKARYNPELLEQMTVLPTDATSGMNFTSNVKDGYIYISMAGTRTMEEDGAVAKLVFKTADMDDAYASSIDIVSFIKNEDDLTASTKSAAITVKVPTGLENSKNTITGVKAYPNPFDTQLNLNFKVQESSMVSVKVYNLYGQLVNVLTQNQHVSGQYSLTWDGANGNGKQVTKGVYFVKFVAEDKEQVLKVQMF